MLIRSFPAGAFGTNCYAVASAPGQECVVVDPGMDAVEPLARMLADDGLKPVAVVLTHGHLDHTFSVLPVCDGYDIPAYLHPADTGMLADPARWHGPQLAPLISGVRLPDPSEVKPLDDATVVLPGHGPETTIGRERATYPYLAEAAAAPKGRGL